MLSLADLQLLGSLAATAGSGLCRLELRYASEQDLQDPAPRQRPHPPPGHCFRLPKVGMPGYNSFRVEWLTHFAPCAHALASFIMPNILLSGCRGLHLPSCQSPVPSLVRL